MSLTFQGDLLETLSIESAGDDFGDCTKSGVCFGLAKHATRPASQAQDSDARSYVQSEGHCAVYLHGKGHKNAYIVRMDSDREFYWKSVNTSFLVSKRSFLRWVLPEGSYRLMIDPENVTLPFDCRSGEQLFTHFEYHRIGDSSLVVETTRAGQAHLKDLQLYLPLSREQ
jgi:hypothetical protein